MVNPWQEKHMTDIAVILDFETTGLSPHEGARPTEVAAVVVGDGRIIDRYQSLMNPGTAIPRFITELTGISNAMVRNAPAVGQVMRELHRFVGNHPIVAHNASFDRKFMVAELDRLKLTSDSSCICSMRIARRLYPNAPNHKLGTLVSYLALKKTGQFHRALADAEMTAHLWLRMRADLKTTFGYQSIPIALMERLQTVTTVETSSFLEKYKEQHRLGR